MFITCLKIFIARVIDVTLNTLKTINIVKGHKYTSTILSFFEVLIWLEVSKDVLSTNINSILIPISYALGYSLGTYLGIIINNKYQNKKS